jgi:hypothetical protein
MNVSTVMFLHLSPYLERLKNSVLPVIELTNRNLKLFGHFVTGFQQGPIKAPHFM